MAQKVNLGFHGTMKDPHPCHPPPKAFMVQQKCVFCSSTVQSSRLHSVTCWGGGGGGEAGSRGRAGSRSTQHQFLLSRGGRGWKRQARPGKCGCRLHSNARQSLEKILPWFATAFAVPPPHTHAHTHVHSFFFWSVFVPALNQHGRPADVAQLSQHSQSGALWPECHVRKRRPTLPSKWPENGRRRVSRGRSGTPTLQWDLP